MTPVYRADQVGSLLRPPEVLDGRAAFASGSIGPERLREIEDEAVLQALEMQRQVGIDVFTDGEYRRLDYRSDFAEAVDGMVTAEAAWDWRGPGGVDLQPNPAWVVEARLQQRRRLTAHESGFLRDHAPGPFKVTLPSAANVAASITDRIYPTRSDLLGDIVDILNREIVALADEGVPYIQIDAPGYAVCVDKRRRERLRASGMDPEQHLEEAIEADNACLRGVRRNGVTLAIHICRGNYLSHWLSEGGYEPIAERLFGTLEADRFLLEYDTGRAGGFEPLRFVPQGKMVVLGLVTTKGGQLESQDLLLRRIEEASRYIPVDELAISPQCRFASGVAGNLLSADDQRGKLELVVDTARKVWG